MYQCVSNHLSFVAINDIFHTLDNSYSLSPGECFCFFKPLIMIITAESFLWLIPVHIDNWTNKILLESDITFSILVFFTWNNM